MKRKTVSSDRNRQQKSQTSRNKNKTKASKQTEGQRSETL
jgi:hypothetical protein